MLLPIITNFILFIAFSILIFWPFFNNEKLYGYIKRQTPLFGISIGILFGMTSVAFQFLSPNLEDTIFSNYRILLIYIVV